jgi:hypothetical protein
VTQPFDFFGAQPAEFAEPGVNRRLGNVMFQCNFSGRGQAGFSKYFHDLAFGEFPVAWLRTCFHGCVPSNARNVRRSSSTTTSGTSSGAKCRVPVFMATVMLPDAGDEAFG